MTYAEVRDVIAMYANAVLPLFADAWSRWPTGRAGHAVITKLAQEHGYWEKQDEAIAAKLRDAQIAVRNHI